MIYLDSAALLLVSSNNSLSPTARALLSQLDLIPLSGALIEQVADTGDPVLRTMDALHLASALSIRAELTAFVAYDHRLLAAAAAAGIETTRPAGTVPTNQDSSKCRFTSVTLALPSDLNFVAHSSNAEDGDQLLQAGKVVGVAGVQGEAVGVGGRRDQQISDTTSVPAAGLDNCSHDEPAAAGSYGIERQRFEHGLDPLKPGMPVRPFRPIRGQMRTCGELGQSYCAD